MSDDADLQAKIAALAGQINRYKNGQQQPQIPNQPPRQYNNRYQQRWTPYNPRSMVFKNKTLVNASTITPTGDTNHSTTPTTDAPFVNTRGVNNQLMTHSTYLREQQAKQAHIPIPRAIDRQRTDSMGKLTTARIIDIAGLKFEMKEDGSKLTRKDDTSKGETPRRAVIAGVEFLRTKNGNLLRKGVVQDATRTSKEARLQCEKFTKNGTRLLSMLVYDLRRGKCPYGPKCRFAHDPQKVAVCKDFLRTGTCSNGEYCDLSHKPDYHRVPACLHFQKGACNNDDCRYPHVRVTPGTPVCRPFATLGYCEDGKKCDERHVFECPDYANTGRCPNIEKCTLTHVLRASTERAAHAGSDSEIDMSDDEAGSSTADVDSEDMIEALVAGHADAQLEGDDFISL